MTEGVEVVCHPVDIVLPPESGTVPVKLLLTPRQVGQLNIIGMNWHLSLVFFDFPINHCLLFTTTVLQLR